MSRNCQISAKKNKSPEIFFFFIKTELREYTEKCLLEKKFEIIKVYGLQTPNNGSSSYDP